MIKHVVMWRLKDSAVGGTKAEKARRAKEALEALGDSIPVIVSIEAGTDLLHGNASYDLVLVSEFASLDDLAAYQVHPAHMKVVDLMTEIAYERAVVDYEVED